MKITIEFDSLREIDSFIEWRRLKEGEKLKTPIRQCGLFDRTVSALIEEGYYFLEDAQALTDDELLKIKDLGRKSLNDLRAIK